MLPRHERRSAEASRQASPLLPRPEFYRRDSCFEPMSLRREGAGASPFQEHKLIVSRLVELDASGERYTSHIRDCRRSEAKCVGVRVLATTFNVGNARVNDSEMSHWLSQAEGCDVVALALQEANYLSSSQKRGLAMVAGFTMLGVTVGPVGMGAGLAVGATTAGAMALHSHVMPKLRRAIHRRNGRTTRATSGDGSDSQESEEEELSSEDEDEEYAKKGHEGTPMLASAIANAIDRQLEPRGFERSIMVAHGQMRLAVYARPGVLCQAKGKKHGMGMAMNKGGLAARVCVSKDDDELELCFIGAHLPAHEGKRKDRTEALTEIATTFEADMAESDFVFLFGDLNYRLSTEDDEPPFEFADAENLARARRLAPLHDADELVRELVGLQPAPCLRGFATPSCDFPPTFKLRRKHLDAYNDKRLPAWCDRVLVKTKPRCALQLERYYSVPHVLSSDHKPVVFVATIRRFRALSPSPNILDRPGPSDHPLTPPTSPGSASTTSGHARHSSRRSAALEQSTSEAAAALLADSP